MRKIRVEDAIGVELCHDITAIRDGFKGAAFKRGHVITRDDVDALLDIGKRSIYLWDDEDGCVHEEDAALRLAAAMPVEGAHYAGPSEGKMTLVADADGLFMVDRSLLASINAIGDITVTTLPGRYPVARGARLASMRIVPLVTSEAQIAEAERLCAGRQLFSLTAYHHRRAAVIITGSEVFSGRIKDKFEPVARRKLGAFPCEIADVRICDDGAEGIASHIRDAASSGAELILLSGGMSVDPDDSTPDAIRMSGAQVVSHGVPSQPGNMTMLAYLGNVPVIGVPGAAISMPVTVLDVLLPHIFAGVRVSKDDLLRLAEGGLCQQCEVCHFPNCTFGRI